MTSVDIVVAGAGAAGLVAGIAAAERGSSVVILDSRAKIGAKILAAGGGRCNVTNEYVAPSCFNGGPERFTGRVLRAFGLDATLRFFESIGVPLALEESGKYFPASNTGRTVLDALVTAASQAGAVIRTGAAVQGIEPGARWKVAAGGEAIEAKAVVLCTGGLAMPASGSTGDGYPWLARLGHTIVPTSPALSPLIARRAAHAELSGLTMPARLSLRAGADELAAFDGSFLFTHTGYSGPAALNISRHVARWRWERPEADVFASFLPDVAAPDEDAFWRSLLASEGRKTAAGALGARMPRRAAEMIAAEAGLGAGARIGSLSREESARLRAALFECRLRISSVAGYGKAEATAGGASLDEIEPATMMSRIAPGLFVAGELCDVDGWLGGYNFQWAWSSGTVAGRGASAYCRRTKSAGGPRA